MAGANSWRIPTDYETYQKQMEKRLLHEERRPMIAQASDLLGPGSAPHAVQEWDWNSDAAAFVGVFFSNPVDGQANSPDDTKYWIGETFGTNVGYGFQRLTEVFVVPPGAPTPNIQIRYFTAPAGLRLYTAWTAL